MNLINPNNHQVKSNQIWWASQEAKNDYDVTEEELHAIGIIDKTILIHEKLIKPLQKVNRELAIHNLEIEIDDGYRSPELYALASRKVATKKGLEASKSLFNLEKMPHSSGMSVDLAIVNRITNEREMLFDKKDGVAASFLGFYEQFSDIESQRKVSLQKLLGRIMLNNGFQYGTKNEVWHFDYISTSDMRTSPTQIPTKDELMLILTAESKRRVPTSKLASNSRLVDYAPLMDIMEYLHLDFDKSLFVSDSENLWEIAKPALVGYLNQIIDKLVLTNSYDKNLIHLLDTIYDYLTDNDCDIINQPNFVADIGFVFGSKSTIRAEKALELYRLGKISKIMISGKSPFYNDSVISEAENLANFLSESGIPRIDIIEERQALTIPGNVKRSLDLLEEQNLDFKSIVIITSPFAMRRSYVDWLKFLPVESSVQIYRINSNVSDKFSKSQWYKTEEGLRIIINEYFKLRLEWFIDKHFSEVEKSTSQII